MIFLGNDDNDHYYYNDDMVYVYDAEINFKYFYGSVTRFIKEYKKLCYTPIGNLLIHVKLTGNELYDCRQAARVIQIGGGRN